MKVQKFIIAEKSESFDQEQSIVGWGSKPIPDRDGELIESSAWKLDGYKKNPVLMLSHDYASPPVGKILWIKSDENGLKFKAKFAGTERGKEIYQLYKEGIMSGFSVGFSINQATDHPTDEKYKSLHLKRVYHDVDLLEISCVAIPACPDALIEQVKSQKIMNKQLKDELDHVIELVEKEKELVTKPEVTQNYVRIPVSAGHTDCSIRTIDISGEQGIKALYCVDDKVVITYLFEKDKWDMDSAKKWIEQHKKEMTIFHPTFEDDGQLVCKGGILFDGAQIEEKPVQDVVMKVDVIDPEVLLRVIMENKDKLAAIFMKQDEPVGDDEEECKCPGGGKCGEDYGDYEECKDCEYAGKCKGDSEEKACGDGGKKKPVKKTIYEVVATINAALSVPAKGKDEQPYVVDVLPDEYPNGEVIYFADGAYIKSAYEIDEDQKTVHFIGREFVALELIAANYPAEVQSHRVEKQDSSPYFELEDEKPIIEIIDKSVKDDMVEIDADMIKEVMRDTFSEIMKSNTKDIVSDMIKRIKGRVE